MMVYTATIELQMPLCRGIHIEELSIPQLQHHLATSAFTSRELTKCFLERIHNLNARIKAIIETNPDALKIADDLDLERKTGRIRSRIHGIPFLVKDSIATKDKMQTTAGSAALVGAVVAKDATVVELLRAAGGVLLGKSNLSEWACMRASHYSEGYSSRGGQNRNPYNLAEHPGGSSSGSASALAANMCAFSIGTETDGSIMFPADRNAIVGFKPTVGLVSTSGVIPISTSFDVVGPFTRSVEDAAIVMDIISDRKTNSGPYTSFLATKDALKGAKFGLPSKRVWDTARQSRDHESEYLALMDLIERIEKSGSQISYIDFPSAEDIISAKGWDWSYANGNTQSELSALEVGKFEFREGISNYLSGLGKNPLAINSLEDIVTYNINHTTTEGGVPGTHPAWPSGQDVFQQCLDSMHMDEKAYLRALHYIRTKSREQGIDAALKDGEQNLDGLLVPLQADGGVACSVAAKAGYPMIAIPVGVNEKTGVPFGLGIIQTAWQESKLIRFGSAIEELAGPRYRPRFFNFNAENYCHSGAATREI